MYQIDDVGGANKNIMNKGPYYYSVFKTTQFNLIQLYPTFSNDLLVDAPFLQFYHVGG